MSMSVPGWSGPDTRSQNPAQRNSTQPAKVTAARTSSDTAATSVAEMKPALDALASDMFRKTADYLQGELEGCVDDYKLLEDMNKATTQRYADMKQVTQNLGKSLQELNEKCRNLQPYLEQVDEIDASSRRLEEAAYALDAYVKALESRFKQMEKR